MSHVRPAVSLPMIISAQRVIYTPSVGEGVVMSPGQVDVGENGAH